MKIFIQVASYRDPQLIPTIESALENAKYPENLVFGIARQYHPDDKFDDLSKYEKDDRFRILNIFYLDAMGACWARNQIQQLYKDEEYTLQIDSHMRFEKDWDVEMIKMITDLQEKGHKKPLLTGYVSSFDPDNDPIARVREPWRMVFDRFIPEGAVFFLPETIPGWQELTTPVTARFYSAHYCFTLGQFAKEVQHDPEYYFHGEEISIAARAYTWGYDLFHPHRVLIWHEYTRKGRTKQWDDDKKWVDKNNLCHKKNRALFGMDGEESMDFGIYGFGPERTLRDYEKYSGLLFSRRAIQQETIDKKYPPNTYNYETEEEWMSSFASIFKHCIDIGYSQVPEDDYDFWAVAFHGEDDETIYRKDADSSEIRNMKNDPDGYCKVWREFQTTIKPKYWVVWPYSKSKGWGERITGNL
jgi:glycosyltransferase involved in cell wall biosynthesis